MVPVSRWLTIYIVRGENGKVKSLLRVALYGSLVAALVMSVLAGLFLPGLFRVARVAERGFFVILLFALLGPTWNVVGRIEGSEWENGKC